MILPVILPAQIWWMQTAYVAMFQTGWFIESMWSQTLVIHMIRTPKLPFIQSQCICTTDADDIYRNRSADDHSIYYIWQNVGFVALPTAYFAYLIPCILLYMVLATSLKKKHMCVIMENCCKRRE